MKIPIASVSIYRKYGAPQLLLMHYAPYYDSRGDYKGNGCWGDLQTVALDQFEVHGLEIIRASFRGFNARRRDYDDLADRQGFDVWTPAQRKHFCKEYFDVDASNRENGEIWLDPTKPRKLGHDGMSDEADRIIIPSHATPSLFYAGVLEAFKRCTESS